MSILERLTGRRRRKAAESKPEPFATVVRDAGEPVYCHVWPNPESVTVSGLAQGYQNAATNTYPNQSMTYVGRTAAAQVVMPPADAYPRVTSAALRDAARRLVALSRDCPDGVAYELRLLATLVVAPAAEDAEEREARERGERS